MSQVKSLLEVCPEDVKDTVLKLYYKEMPNLRVGKDGILRHRTTQNPSGAGQIAIPGNRTSIARQMMHDDLGHFGTAKTATRGKEKFFWPSMSLEHWCTNRLPCQRKTNPVPTRTAPLQPIVACSPGELVTLDIVEYPLSSQGFRCFLIMVDHFSKWLEFVPSQSDGTSERSIRTVNRMLAKIVQQDQRNGDLYISSSCLAYNTSIHSSKGFTLNF